MAMAYSRDFPYLGWVTTVSLGLAASLALFGSVLAHELAHALVAIRYGVPIRGIILFIFGGAAELGDEPPNAAAELNVAIAGPAMSLALAMGFAGLYTVGIGSLPASIMEVTKYLAFMNGILVAFNLVPGFPLDGGRVLRAVLWGIWGDLRLATRTASLVGSGFGLLIIFLGFTSIFLFDHLVGGIWYVFIGVFLRNAARSSYQHTLIKESMRGIKVRDVMDEEVVTAEPSMVLDDLVHKVMLTSGVTELPVVDGDNLRGLIGLKEVKAIDRARWSFVTVAEAMRPFDSEVAPRSVSADDEANRLLILAAGGEALIPVVDDRRFVGVVSTKDLLRRIQLRMELKEDSRKDWYSTMSSAGVGAQQDTKPNEHDGYDEGQQRQSGKEHADEKDDDKWKKDDS
jgi:Zn-dependent protease